MSEPLLPEATLRKYAKDPGFRKLTPDAQERLIRRLSQEQYGKIPKSESLLQRVVGGIKEFKDVSDQAMYGNVNSMLGGIPENIEKRTGFQMSPGEPKSTMQNIGRVGGDISGYAMGAPELISSKIAGGIANPLLRGMTRGATGMATYTPANIVGGTSFGKEAGKIGAGGITGGLVEGVPNMLFKGLFGKNISKARAEELRLKLEGRKTDIANDPNAIVDTTQLTTSLENMYSKSAPEVQRKLTSIKRWISDLKSSGNKVHPDMVRQMEEEIGAEAKFMGQKGGFFQFQTKPKSPNVNKVLQKARTETSNLYDTVAGPEFASQSKEVSGILKRFPDEDPSRAIKSFTKKALATGAGSMLGGLPGGLAGLALEALTESPILKQNIFQKLSSAGAKKTGEAIASGTRGLVGTSAQKY